MDTHHHVLSHTSTVTFYDGHQDDDDKEEECHIKNQPHILWSSQWQTETHQQEAGTQQHTPHSHSHVLYPQMEINENLRKSCSQHGLVNCALLQGLLINATSRPQSMAHRRSDRRNTSIMNRANIQPTYVSGHMMVTQQSRDLPSMLTYSAAQAHPPGWCSTSGRG